MTLAIIAIVITCLAILIVSFTKLSSKYYPLLIFTSALSLVWQTSLQGYGVVGSDIQREFYMSSMALQSGWDINYFGEMSNSSIAVGLFCPLIARILHVDLLYVYKYIVPFLFAFVPVILYYAFSKQFGNKRAFYASMFFVIIPVFFIEIPAIVKSMFAEVFFALMILTMLSNLRLYYKIPATIACLVLSLMSHYTVGGIALAYFICMVIVQIVTKPVKWQLLSKRIVPIWASVVILVVSVFGGYYYYKTVYNGLVLNAIGFVGEYVAGTPTQNMEVVTGNHKAVNDVKPPESTSDGITPRVDINGNVVIEPEKQKNEIYLSKQPPMIRLALGFDFANVSVWGKAFRIIQFITQLLIVVGAVWLIFNYKQYSFSVEFLACILASFGLLAMCIFIPNFSRFINMTRFYQLSLFFLAPMFVLGIENICRKLQLSQSQ